MALTKAFLKETLSKAGCDPETLSEVVGKILDGHTASIEALREERDGYKADLETAKANLKELEGLKKESGDYASLKKEYDDFKAKVETEKVRGAKESAYKGILKEAGIPERHYSKILKYSDVDSVELDEEGKVTNAKDIMKSIKDEWSDHIETSSATGTTTPTPPTNVGGSSAKTMKEIMSIKNTSARQAEIAKMINNNETR